MVLFHLTIEEREEDGRDKKDGADGTTASEENGEATIAVVFVDIIVDPGAVKG